MDINSTVDKVIEWLECNNLKINLNKSKYIQFNKSKHPKYNFKLNIHKIEEVSEIKFLGIILDQNLSWKLHISNLCKRVNKFIYALYQIKNITDRKTAILTYHAYIESILRYAIVIWGNSTDWKKAFITQKKCIRAICGIQPDQSCAPYFKQLSILPLPCLYILETCNFVYKHKNLFKMACELRNSRVRRNPHKLTLMDVPRSAKYNSNCLTMCVKIYNHIPNEIKKYNTYRFKRHLFRWLSDQNFYSVKDFLNFKK